VVCEILKLNCDLYKYMFYLSHGKAKEKNKKTKKKGRRLPRVPGHLALGEEETKKKAPGLPRVPCTWHSGKTKIKKKPRSLPRVPWQMALGEKFSKKKNFFPECCSRGRG
jgi:hypothetical protein